MFNTQLLNLNALNTAKPASSSFNGVVRYNGYTFPNSNFKLTRIGNFFSSGSIERDIFDKADSHGRGIRNYFFKEKYMEIEGVITGNSKSDLQENINSLVSAIAVHSQTLKFISDDGILMQSTAHCESWYIEKQPYHITFAPVSLRFVSLDPFFKGSITQEELFSSQTTSFTDTVQYTTGTYKAQPTITITFSTGLIGVSSVAVQIGDNTITLSESISNNDIVIIDCDEQDVSLNGAGGQDYTGSFPELEIGDNSITVTINGTWTADVSVTRNNTYV